MYIDCGQYENALALKTWFDNKCVSEHNRLLSTFFTIVWLHSDFQNRRVSATLTNSSQGNPFRTLPKGKYIPPAVNPPYQRSLPSLTEPPPRDGRMQPQQVIPATIPNTNSGGNMNRGGGGGGNFRGVSSPQNMNMMGMAGRGGMMGGMMRNNVPAMMGGMGMGGMGGMGMGGMGAMGMNMGFAGAGMGGGFGGGGRGGGMIPQGPRGGGGGMMGGRGGMMGGMGTSF